MAAGRAATDSSTRCRELFGDETADYQAAIDRHYAEGPPAGWEASHITTYATMHPFEDFAETWAHYLHICDTVETAARVRAHRRRAGVDAFSQLPRPRDRGAGCPLSIALNMINRRWARTTSTRS